MYVAHHLSIYTIPYHLKSADTPQYLHDTANHFDNDLHLHTAARFSIQQSPNWNHHHHGARHESVSHAAARRATPARRRFDRHT
jgi:hypothetical protein